MSGLPPSERSASRPQAPRYPPTEDRHPAVVLSAGPGTAGLKGESTKNYTAPTALGGIPQNGSAGGGPVTCTCVDLTLSKGGMGGSKDADVTSGSSVPSVGTANFGGTGANCAPGLVGSNGLAGKAGNAALRAGVLTGTGWDSTGIGTAATNSNPGQGGGGGETEVNSGGGGGACGGCGGGGGAAGTNGGSSFAVLSFNSSVIIEGGTLITGLGGAGGPGGDGQDGQTGGTGADGACAGGNGGNGAGGSGGGGGAGGHSAPVAFVGTEPKVTGASVMPGAKGDSGTGGKGGGGLGVTGAEGPPGPAGASQPSLALQ